MKRNLVVLLAIGLIVGSLAPAQAAKKKKKPKPPPAPVAVDVTYNVGWDGTTCNLSTTTNFVNPDNSCGDPFAGSTTGDVATTTGLSDGAPITIAAIDGLPLTLDATKKVSGKILVGSYTLAALADNGLGQPLGAGEGSWHVVVSGSSAGEDVTLGEVTTPAYLVTPGNGSYEVTFEIAPDAALDKKVFDSFSVSLQQVGSATVHGAIQTEGSTVTLGAFK